MGPSRSRGQWQLHVVEPQRRIRGTNLTETIPMGEFFKQFWEFMKVRKKWWLGPIVGMLLLLGLLLVLTQGSAVAPFIYTLF